MQTYSLTIDGKAATTARTSNILNPADGTLVAACPEGDIALLDRAAALNKVATMLEAGRCVAWTSSARSLLGIGR